MGSKKVALQSFGHDISHVVLCADEHDIYGTGQTLFAQPMKPAIDVPAVLVCDWIVGNADRRFIVGEDVDRVTITALNAKITNKHAIPNCEPRSC